MRTRKILVSAALTAGLIGLGASAASADEYDYVPDTYKAASLAGSTASSQCINDVPYITVSVKLTDPDHQSKSDIAYLRLTDGTEVEDILLGQLDKNGELTKTILWPGADTNDDGTADSWPGWEFNGTTWVPVDGNFGWTRENITATLHVNPEIDVPLSYPAATEACASPTAVSAEMPGLAATGGAVPYLAAGFGVAALALGAGLIARRRRATR